MSSTLVSLSLICFQLSQKPPRDRIKAVTKIQVRRPANDLQNMCACDWVLLGASRCDGDSDCGFALVSRILCLRLGQRTAGTLRYQVMLSARSKLSSGV